MFSPKDKQPEDFFSKIPLPKYLPVAQLVQDGTEAVASHKIPVTSALPSTPSDPRNEVAHASHNTHITGGVFTNVEGDHNIFIDARNIQVQNTAALSATAHHRPEDGGFQVSALSSMLAMCGITTGHAGAAPIPALKGAFGAVASILEASAAMKTARKDSMNLATHCFRLVSELNELAEASRSPPTVVSHVADIARTLEEINIFFQLQSRMSRLKAFVSYREIVNQINDKEKVIEDFFKMLSTLKAQGNLETSAETDYGVCNDCEVIQRNRLVLSREARVLQSGTYVHHAKIKPSGELVIVKCFTERSKHNFIKELVRCHAMMHPNVPTILAHSNKAATKPFLVFPDYTRGSIGLYMKDRLDKPSRVESFMVGIRLMQDIMSGLSYLCEEVAITKRELESCLQVPNLLLNGENTVVLGHDTLFSTMSMSMEPESPVTEVREVDNWIKDKCYTMFEEITLGDVCLDRWSEWESAGGKIIQSHMRMLLNFSCFAPGFTLTGFKARLERFTDVIQGAGSGTRSIAFPDIRCAMMEAGVTLNHLFRPKTRLDADAGDLGYFEDKDGDLRFVKLCSLRDQIDTEILNSAPSLLWVSCNGGHTIGEPKDGVIRYEFYSPVHYATIRRSNGRSGFKDQYKAWRYLLDHGAELYRRYGLEHGINITDMVLIVQKEDDQRLAFFEQDAKTAELALDSVYFDEVVDPAPGANQWGKFYFPTYIDTPVVGATTWTWRFAHTLLLAQLEPEDVNLSLVQEEVQVSNEEEVRVM